MWAECLKTSHDCKLVFCLFDSCLKQFIQTDSLLLHLWLMRVVVDYRTINPKACVVTGALSYKLLAGRSILMEEKCPTSPISIIIMYLYRVYISCFGFSA